MLGDALLLSTPRTRVFQAVLTFGLAFFSFYLFGALTQSERVGNEFFAVSAASFTVACVVIALRALRYRHLEREAWSVAMQSSREAVAWGVVVGIAALFSLPGHVKGELRSIMDGVVEAGFPFLCIGVWLLFVGNDLSRRLEVERKGVHFASMARQGDSRSLPLLSPTASTAVVLALVVLNGFAWYLFSAGAAVEGPLGPIIVNRSSAATWACVGLIVFGTVIALHSGSLRRATPERFCRAGALVRQFIVLNGIWLLGVAYLVFVDPFQQRVLDDVIPPAAGLLLGMLLIEYFGSGWTEFNNAFAESRHSSAPSSEPVPEQLDPPRVAPV